MERGRITHVRQTVNSRPITEFDNDSIIYDNITTYDIKDLIENCDSIKDITKKLELFIEFLRELKYNKCKLTKKVKDGNISIELTEKYL